MSFKNCPLFILGLTAFIFASPPRHYTQATALLLLINLPKFNGNLLLRALRSGIVKSSQVGQKTKVVFSKSAHNSTILTPTCLTR